jgi:hypothetical protein
VPKFRIALPLGELSLSEERVLPGTSRLADERFLMCVNIAHDEISFDSAIKMLKKTQKRSLENC